MAPSKETPTELHIKVLSLLVDQLAHQMLRLMEFQRMQVQEQPQLTQQIQDVREMRLQAMKELDRLTRIAGVMRQYQ